MRRALNKGMRDEWEFQQYEREETLELFGPSKAIWDPRMMVFAEVDGELAGVAVGWPDWTPLFRSLHGRAGPIATLTVLRNWRKMEKASRELPCCRSSAAAASVPRCSLASSPGSRRWGSRAASTST